jgi:hypothetical protein
MTKLLEQAVAKARGLSDAEQDAIGQFVLDQIECELRARTQTFDQIFSLVRSDFRKSGMTDKNLDTLVNNSRARHRSSKARKKH